MSSPLIRPIISIRIQNVEPITYPPNSQGCEAASALLKFQVNANTRIIIYNGHREIGLVLAGHYFPNQIKTSSGH